MGKNFSVNRIWKWNKDLGILKDELGNLFFGFFAVFFHKKNKNKKMGKNLLEQ